MLDNILYYNIIRFWSGVIPLGLSLNFFGVRPRMNLEHDSVNKSGGHHNVPIATLLDYR